MSVWLEEVKKWQGAVCGRLCEVVCECVVEDVTRVVGATHLRLAVVCGKREEEGESAWLLRKWHSRMAVSSAKKIAWLRPRERLRPRKVQVISQRSHCPTANQVGLWCTATGPSPSSNFVTRCFTHAPGPDGEDERNRDRHVESIR